MKSVTVRKYIVTVAAMLGGLAIVALVGVQWGWTRRFDAPYPTLAASSRPDAVARGEYIVYSSAACAYCHVPRREWAALARGERLPLTGDHVFPLPFGKVYSANLTPDPTTGIGRRTDADIARVLRTGVRADGRVAFPLMEIQLTDEDLIGVLSYLRIRPAVAHTVPEHAFTLLGKALMTLAIKPAAAPTPAAVSPVGPTIDRGDYLANRVSSCFACHTDRGEDGQLVGTRFAGGQRMDVAADPTKVYVTPNLTPDPESSPIGRWTEAEFIARFRQGERVEGTPMPWGAYAGLTEDDLRALYRYLRSLPPTRHLVGPAVQATTTSLF